MRWLQKVKKPWYQVAVLIATVSVAVYLGVAYGPPQIDEPGYCRGDEATESPYSVPQYRFLKGDRNTYRMVYESNSEYDFSVLFEQGEKSAPAESPGGLGLHQVLRATLTADLEATVVDRSGDGYRIQYKFLAPKALIYSNGQPAEGYTYILQKDLVDAAVATVDPQGKITSLAVRKDINRISRGYILALLGMTQFVAPRDDSTGSRWTVQEDDPNGIVEVVYAQIGSAGASDPARSYRKTKKKYEVREPVDGNTRRVKKEILPEGELVAVFDFAHSRLKNLEGVEKQEIRVAGKHVGRVSTSLKMSHVSYACRAQEVFARAGQPEGDADLAAPLPLYFDGTTPEQRETSIHRNTLGEDTLETLFGRLRNEAGGSRNKFGDTSLYLKFKAIVFLQPETSRALGRYLRGRKLDSVPFQMLTGVLSVVGHAEAQRAMIDLMKQRADEPAARVHLIQAVATVKTPIPELVEYMRSLAGSSHDDTAATAELALGVMAGNLYKRDKVSSDRIVQSFVNELRSASDPDRIRLVLLILGNAATPLAYKTISGFMDHESPDIRAAALSSLRSVQDPEVDQRLRASLKKDADNDVRKAAVATIGFRPMNDAGFSALKSAFKDEPDSGVRRTILEVLWNARRDYPEAGKIVAGAAESDHDPKVRKAAKALLPGE